MKKRIVLFSIAFLACFMYINAQSGYGIKAGLSYNSTGKLWSETGDIIDNKGKGKSGFNLGFYGKLDLGPIYLRPELVYTKTTSEYSLNSQLQDYKISKIDAPVLLGINLIGPLDFFAGPSFQYILDNDLKGLKYENVENDFSIGMNLGVGIEFGRIGIDVRYERGFNSNEAKFIDNNTGIDTHYRLDARPEQIIFSLSYSLSDNNKV